MKDPTNPKRNMMPRDEALRTRAELDFRLETARTPEEFNAAMLDDFFAPFEVACPILAELTRRHRETRNE
jgi:hypothetical protein